jgi:HEPN domain-containing protein
MIMVDIDKQISYWKENADEDWAVARLLLEGGRIRHSLFFANLALEKALKALVCKSTGDLAPRIHNLTRLIGLTGLAASSAQADVLAEMNAFHIEGRYPESLTKPPTKEEAVRYIKRAEEVFRWLTSLL